MTNVVIASGVRIGRPEQFFDKVTLRFNAMERANKQFQFVSGALMPPEIHPPGVSSFRMKGFGNEVNLLGASRELWFASRELIDIYLGRLSKATAGTGKQTPHDLLPFLKRLMAGDYDDRTEPIFKFLKTNAGYLFHIRKIRNHLKSHPESADFVYVGDHFILRMSLPVKREDESLLPMMEIPDVESAMKNGSYSATVKLEIMFPEMVQFWRTFDALFKDSFPTTSVKVS